MNKNLFPEFDRLDLAKFEEQILTLWDENRAFEKSIERRGKDRPFIFYEGPPSANGLPGIHHVISRAIKDLFCRYKTMRGYKVPRKAGWDTHGLPIELSVEKKLNITKKDIGVKISVEEYNRVCREEVLKYKNEWNELTRRMGYWVDLEHPYVTFDNTYIESVWWCISELYKRKLLYKSITIQPYSPAAGTGLSSHELNQPGTYRNVKDISVFALFRMIENERSQFLFERTRKGVPVYMMAWTTTPWTLPSNLALAVNKSIDYELIETANPYTKENMYVILATDLVGKYFSEGNKNKEIKKETVDAKNLPWSSVLSMKGDRLLGARYEQLIPLPANRKELIGGDPFRIIHSDHVTVSEGTGVVHMAPAFGADDLAACAENRIGFICLVDKEGKFVEGMDEWSGRYVKNYKDEKDYQDVNVDICVHLKKLGNAFHIEKYEHNYPHCWRTDKPILYYPLDAWFVKIKGQSRLSELNKTINWKPASTGEGRFGNWLQGAVDWNLSRSRFWGTPLPVWRTQDKQEEKCIGSLQELTKEYIWAVEKKTMQDIFPIKEGIIDMDLHKPYIDRLVFASASGKPMYRESDLIDVWFDSGAMPYAQLHYPFENKDELKNRFPADFICEGVDQTRGWFYTLHVIAVLLFDSVAFKNVISNGLVLDKDGNKMSKRLGNVVDPGKIISSYGADAMRWYLVTNSSPWENMRFDESGVQEAQRRLFGTLYNTYQFFAMYANVDKFSYRESPIPMEERTELDRWIISSLQMVAKNYIEQMDNYEPLHAHRLIGDFIDEHLSNWYVRLSRRRFWKDTYSSDKIAAYQTLYEVLETLSQLMAPLAPFFSEWLFRNLNAITKRKEEESVHHLLLSLPEERYIDKELSDKMNLAQTICSLALSIRKQENIKVRQPLKQLLVSIHDAQSARYLKETEEIIKQEINVKEILHLESDSSILTKTVKPIFSLLGRKLGKAMPALTSALAKLSREQIDKLEKGEDIDIALENGESIRIQPSEVEVVTQEIQGWRTASKDKYTVALDISLTPELEAEGNAREFVNRIQNVRKEYNFKLTDKIKIMVIRSEFFVSFFTPHYDYICSETLASSIDMVSSLPDEAIKEIDVKGVKIYINIKKSESL